jgi:hypothetical protein
VATVSVPRPLWLPAIAALLALAAPALASSASASSVSCPASASASAGPVQWLFSQLGKPNPAESSLSWSWTRGKGSWSAGAASGTICVQDKGGGLPSRNLVLTVSGSAALSPKIVRFGLPGVGLALPVTVAAGDDTACPRHSHGTVTLFASYYSVHRDSIGLRFKGACADHDHTFTGTTVHVEISRNGAQVNST